MSQLLAQDQNSFIQREAATQELIAATLGKGVSKAMWLPGLFAVCDLVPGLKKLVGGYRRYDVPQEGLRMAA